MELIVKIKSGGSSQYYQDGDVVDAMSLNRIYLAHAQMICHHNKFGFKKNEKVCIPDNNELVNFRTFFLMEELAEYTQAITKKDDAAALDALVDIVYIALGTAWLFNLPFEKAWKEVQTANMKKIRAKCKSKKRGTSRKKSTKKRKI